MPAAPCPAHVLQDLWAVVAPCAASSAFVNPSETTSAARPFASPAGTEHPRTCFGGWLRRAAAPPQPQARGSLMDPHAGALPNAGLFPGGFDEGVDFLQVLQRIALPPQGLDAGPDRFVL